MQRHRLSRLLARLMDAAGAVQSARLGCPGTNYLERGSIEPSERWYQNRPLATRPSLTARRRCRARVSLRYRIPTQALPDTHHTATISVF